jgi:hypothetical protein
MAMPNLKISGSALFFCFLSPALSEGEGAKNGYCLFDSFQGKWNPLLFTR